MKTNFFIDLFHQYQKLNKRNCKTRMTFLLSEFIKPNRSPLRAFPLKMPSKVFKRIKSAQIPINPTIDQLHTIIPTVHTVALQYSKLLSKLWYKQPLEITANGSLKYNDPHKNLKIYSGVCFEVFITFVCVLCTIYCIIDKLFFPQNDPLKEIILFVIALYVIYLSFAFLMAFVVKKLFNAGNSLTEAFNALIATREVIRGGMLVN